MITIEPPSCGSTFVFIGKNSRGQWVAQERNGLFGGLFASRASALHYALFENGHHPEAIIEVASPVELDMSAPPFTAVALADMQPQRRVA